MFDNLSKKKTVVFVFASALIFRVSIVAGYAFGFFGAGLKGADSKLYFTIANNLLAGNGFATEHGATAYVSPLFPIFIAGCLSLFGDTPILISLLQSFLGSLVCVFIFVCAEKTFNSRKIALIAGMLAAVNFEFLMWANAQILTEPIYIFFLTLGILLLVLALTDKQKDSKYFVFSAIAFGLASLTRPISIGIAFGLAIILLAASLFSAKTLWKKPLLFLSVFLLVMLPWGIRNYLVLDSFTISSLEGGHVLWLGNNPQYDKYEHPDFTKFGGYTTMFEFEDLKEKFKGKSEAEKDKIFRAEALNHITSDPIAFLKRALHKNWNMWRPNFSGSSWRNSLVSYTFYPFMLLTAFFGMFLVLMKLNGRSADRLTHPAAILIAIFLMHILIHSVITGEIRFRVPIWTVLTPFSAYSLNILFEKLTLSTVTNR